ncbi:MAG TPA: hypothetical protein VF707_03000 [Ardenticatenaceae bacterium]|jgi:hypothetical protein
MTTKLATFLAVLLFALLALGGGVASAQSPDGPPPDRVQQQRAPAACPPDIQWGCVLSGSTSPGLSLNSSVTANNSYSLYASLNNPGSGSAAVWGRVLGTGSRGYGVYGSHQGSGYGVYGYSNNGIGFLGYSNTSTGMQGETNGTGAQAGILGQHRATSGIGAGVHGRTNSTSDGAVAGVLGTVSSANAGYESAGVRGVNNGTFSVSYGVFGSSASEEGIGVHGESPFIAVRGSATEPTGTGVYGYGGTGVFGISVTTDGKGVYGYAEATTGHNSGVYGESKSETGYGVYGTSNYVGVYGETVSGYGVYAKSDYIGVYGFGSSGYGVYGQSVSGRGVYGKGNEDDGVYGTSTDGDGVEGHSTNNTGVYGHSDSDSSAGVYGYGNSIGVEGYGDIGVYGVSMVNGGVAGFGPPKGTDGYGTYGEGFNGIYGKPNGVAGSRAAWFAGAVYIDGPLHVNGTISGPTKHFKLDHPLDPENQYLQHASIESSEMLNLYTGNVVLDANGQAVVEVPAWFTALNEDFRYQLTPLGPSTSVLYIAEEIRDNHFKIAGGTPGMKVSWLITGVRSDPWAEANPLQVEVLKPEDERGTYLYPEGYGQPESRGVHYEEEQRMREMQDEVPTPAEVPGQ